MIRKNKRRLYRRVRRTLGRFTPISADCGALCEKRCCRGDDKTGMLLFPEERTPLHVETNGTRRLAVCGGTCRRGERPLSCRLFPVLPVRAKRGRVLAQTDKRARGICPLVRFENDVRFSLRFLHRVQRAGKMLYADAECSAFLRQILAEGEETAQILENFL